MKTTNKDLYLDLSMRLDKVHHYRGYFCCLCIFHSNTDTPALFVYESGDYRCASCGAWGSLGRLAHKLSGAKTRYIEETNEPTEIAIPFDKWRRIGYSEVALRAGHRVQEYPILLHYLTVERRLPQDMVDLMVNIGCIGYSDGFITFPVFNPDGIFTDFVVRSTNTVECGSRYAVRPRKNKNEGFILYSSDWERIDNSDTVYIPFGVLDMHAVYYAGFASATGLNGKSYNTEWFKDIHQNIVLIPDDHEEGDAWKFKRRLGWRCSVLELPYEDGEKDSTDILVNRGVDTLRSLIKH